MIPPLISAMNRPFVLGLSLSLLALNPVSSKASDVGGVPSTSTARVQFSVDSFDWREAVPSLFAAAALPSEKGIKEVLEKSMVLRIYIANLVFAECRADKSRCGPIRDRASLDAEIDQRIDEIVDKGMFRRHETAIVDYTLARQPFPFSEIAAEKSEKKEDTYLILAFADHTYTVAQMQAKYGAPYDTDIAQWYSVFKYRMDDPRYTGRAIFEVNPVDGSVLKVAISVRPKKHH